MIELICIVIPIALYVAFVIGLNWWAIKDFNKGNKKASTC